jgi:hypothetical protein
LCAQVASGGFGLLIHSFAQGPDGAPLDGRNGKADMPFDPVLSQQDVACTAHSATCWSAQGYQCDYSKGMYHVDEMQQDKWYELKPGSPAVCAHGNREFSFLASKRADDKKLVIVLAAGGICWDAKTCGDPQARQVALDALLDLVPSPGTGPARELAPAVPRALKDMPLSGSGQAAFEQGLLKRSASNFFGTWSAVVVPDCTGDLHLGNHSYTYDEGHSTCITAHHKGSVNTGEAMKWVLANFLPSEPPSHILLVGSAPSSFKAAGSHGVNFWASYLAQMYPTTIVRAVVDSSLAVNGPHLPDMLRDDPWGTFGARIPNWDHYPVDPTDPEGLLREGAPNGGYLMPPPEEFNLVEDSVTDALRLAEKYFPTLAFADVTTTEDAVQKMWFVTTGGKDNDCCLDGCGCSAAQVPAPCLASLGRCPLVGLGKGPMGLLRGAAFFGVIAACRLTCAWVAAARCARGGVGLDQVAQGGGAAAAPPPAQHLPQLDPRERRPLLVAQRPRLHDNDAAQLARGFCAVDHHAGEQNQRSDQAHADGGDDDAATQCNLRRVFGWCLGVNSGG